MVTKCAVCGTEFDAKTVMAKYCSNQCRENSRYDRRKEDLKAEATARDAEIVTLYESELSAKEICLLFGVSIGVVYKAWHNAGLPKKPTKKQKLVKDLRDQGLCSYDIAKITGMDVAHVKVRAKLVGRPFTDEEKQRSIDKARKKQREDARETSKKYIEEFYPEWEYIDGSINSDGMATIRCKTCGTITKKSCVSIRHDPGHLLVCDQCEEARKRAKEEEKKEQKTQRLREKREHFWSQPFSQMSLTPKRCLQCGTVYFGINRSGYCSDECKKKALNRRHDHRLDRAKRQDRSITLDKLFRRDGGVCWICGEQCDYNDYRLTGDGYFVVGKTYPSIDHVLPLAKGGDHVWENVRLAHHYCNTLKSDKVASYE